MNEINKLVESVEKLTERQYTNQLNSLVTASKQEDADLSQIKEDLKGILAESVDYPKLSEKVQIEIDNVNKLIQIKEAEKEENTSKLAEANSTLNTTLIQLKEMLVSIKDSLKIDFKEGEVSSLKETILSKIVEIQTDGDTAILNEEDMKEDISILLEDIDNAKNDVAYLQEQIIVKDEDAQAMISYIEAFKEERNTMISDITKLKEGIEKLMPFKEFLDNIMDSNASQDGSFDINNPGSDISDLNYVTDEGHVDYESKYKSAYKGLRADQVAFDKAASGIVDSNTGIENQSNVSMQPTEQTGGDKLDITPQKVTANVSEISTEQDAGFTPSSEYKYSESVKRETDPKKAFPIKADLKESSYKKKEFLEEFFTVQVAKYPSLADHKQEIISSKSLMEADKKINLLLEEVEQEPVISVKKSFKESQKGNWLGDRR